MPDEIIELLIARGCYTVGTVHEDGELSKVCLETPDGSTIHIYHKKYNDFVKD